MRRGDNDTIMAENRVNVWQETPLAHCKGNEQRIFQIVETDRKRVLLNGCRGDYTFIQGNATRAATVAAPATTAGPQDPSLSRI